MQTFQRGAAQLALRTSTPILPVVITITPPSLYKGCRWFQMAEKACDLIVDIQPPVEIESFLQQDANPALAARTLTSFLENYYSQRLQGYYKGIQ
jgi:1-acyl-sn-glycerol-3-phosphate acyltransferase